MSASLTTQDLPVFVSGLSILHKAWPFGTQQISSKEGHTNNGLGPWGCMNLIRKSSCRSSFSRTKETTNNYCNKS